VKILCPATTLAAWRESQFSRDGTRRGGHRESGARAAAAEGYAPHSVLQEHSVYHWRRGPAHVVRTVEAAAAMVGCGRGGDAGGGGYGPDSALGSAIPGKGSAGSAARSGIGRANDARHATCLFPSPYYGPCKVYCSHCTHRALVVSSICSRRHAMALVCPSSPRPVVEIQCSMKSRLPGQRNALLKMHFSMC
jgi:hypothetical protein